MYHESLRIESCESKQQNIETLNSIVVCKLRLLKETFKFFSHIFSFFSTTITTIICVCFLLKRILKISLIGIEFCFFFFILLKYPFFAAYICEHQLFPLKNFCCGLIVAWFLYRETHEYRFWNAWCVWRCHPNTTHPLFFFPLSFTLALPDKYSKTNSVCFVFSLFCSFSTFYFCLF